MIEFYGDKINNNYLGINNFHSLVPQDSEILRDNIFLSLQLKQK